ncbi:major facilitator superfamily domain-containing protein [Mycena latifolia]|nr:major facilitator superfamily domain-containing protein [Mycena latifolia]
MGLDLIRDSIVGQLVNYLSRGRLLPYADQRPGYVIPSHFLPPTSARPVSVSLSPAVEEKPDSAALAVVDEGRQSSLKESTGFPDLNLVGWNGEDDPDNPRNWSFAKRVFVTITLCFLTFSVYIGSAIYTASIPGIMEQFNVSLVLATSGLTLYIIGYGLGPMFLAPLQEIPSIGRMPVYIYTLVIFVVFQAVIVTAKNIPTILVSRFLTGACMADMFPMHQLPYIIGAWALIGVAAPILGPVVAGYAAQSNGWRWPMYELLWVSGFALIYIAILLPETYEPTILLKRAQRLRKLAGNDDLHTLTEQHQKSQTAGEIMYEACVRPFVLMTEPVLCFANVYLGFVYAVFYLWFESFPLVFTDIYHFSFGNSNLPFLGYIVTGVFTYVALCLYQRYHIEPRFARAEKENKTIQPEIRLEIGLMTSIFIPTSVLIFGFTAKSSVHWIVPVIAASLYLPGLFLNFNSVLIYITSAYPLYAASVLAGNDCFRSVVASVFPLFGRAFFTNLGLGPGSALLAGISFVLMGCLWLFYKYGHALRARSKYASVEA